MSTAHGLLACFPDAGTFLEGLRQVRAAGYREIETYTPHAVAGADAYLPQPPTPMARVVFGGGLLGGSGGYFLQWYAGHDYPFNVAGRPLTSWPAFVPVTFELTVLGAALAGVGALFWLTRLPRLDHPVFADPRFVRASQDRYFLCIRKTDTQYAPVGTRRFLESLPAESVAEVGG